MRDARGMRSLLVTGGLTINESLFFCRRSVWFKEFAIKLTSILYKLACFHKEKNSLDLIEGVSIQLSKYSAPVDLILGPETRVSFSKYLSFVKIIYIANIKIFR